MYVGAQALSVCLSVVYGNSSGSEVKVGMQQGSAFSPLLFL